MANLTLATEKQVDDYIAEVKKWLKGHKYFSSSSTALYAIAEFNANKDGLTLYKSRSEDINGVK